LLAGHTPPGAFVVGFHGRLRPWHGFERLVEAVARLRARGLPIHLLLIGKGEFAACIGDRLPRACWTHVPWCEYDEVGALVATFDVLPLCYDPTQPCYFSPLKLLEGMAAGALAVVPALGDLAETVLQGRAGVIYDPRDPGGLENAIAMAYQCPSLRSTLTGVARRVAEARSWRSIAQGVLAGTAEAPR
jgi:glycosyltransferase involved in cell wall biosynthesis